MTSPSNGLAYSVRQLFSTLLALAHNRLQLVVVELQEEKIKLVKLAIFGGVGFIAACFGIIFLALFLTVYFWESYRLVVLGGFASLFLLTSVVCVFVAKSLLSKKSALGTALLGELAKDKAVLENKQ